ncbi:MAG: cytochrome c [Candidatus Endonucleobacter sp. (ex Gigantidas childressi)]|nr:cytochrome c [Candidatus Endonucleobacter sp. (ex Gigantidas childressi)]
MKKTISSLIVFWGMTTLAFAVDQHKGKEDAALARLTDSCIICHGAQGISVVPNFPSLAGQGAKYLAKQMMDMKEGIRSVPEMTAFVKDMSEEDINKVASFYANLPAPSGVTESKHVSLGESVYKGGGDNSPSCQGCHSPEGNGIFLAGYPRLAGLNADYIIKQLTDFKEKRRTNDKDSVMRDVAKKLSTEEIKAVAHYIQGLRK